MSDSDMMGIHAYPMGAEDLNVMMLGDINMVGAVDEMTIDHGKEMIDMQSASR